MRFKDFFHDSHPDDMRKVLVIYAGVIPEKLAVPCDAIDRQDILSKHHSGKQYGYIMGYLNTIQRIVASYQGRSTDPIDDDTAYPVLFLVRHVIELSLKLCLRNILTHFKICKSLPEAAGYAVTKTFTCFSQHRLMPIFNEIMNLRSFSSHHKSVRLNSLRDDLIEIDNIDPEATAFRYDLKRDQNQQKLHDRQRWIEIDKLADWSREICNQILEESESDDIDLCESGFYSQESMSELNRMVEALQHVCAWFTRKDTFRTDSLQGATSLDEVSISTSIASIRQSRELTRNFMAEEMDEDVLKYTVLGYYTARSKCLSTIRTCQEQLQADRISARHLEDILEHKKNHLSFELAQLEKILARVERLHILSPFPSLSRQG